MSLLLPPCLLFPALGSIRKCIVRVGVWFFRVRQFIGLGCQPDRDDIHHCCLDSARSLSSGRGRLLSLGLLCNTLLEIVPSCRIFAAWLQHPQKQTACLSFGGPSSSICITRGSGLFGSPTSILRWQHAP
jgi:hypothetical protein